MEDLSFMVIAKFCLEYILTEIAGVMKVLLVQLTIEPGFLRFLLRVSLLGAKGTKN